MEKRIFGIELQVWATLSCFAVVALISIFAPEAMAQALGKIEAKAKSIQGWMVTIGRAVAGIAVVGIGIKFWYARDKNEPKAALVYFLIGAIILGAATEIVNLAID